MTIEEMIQRSPGLVMVTAHLMNSISERIIGLPLDFDKTWAENGYDELDGVDFIMQLEKELNISISDEVASAFIDSSKKPVNISAYNREKKLNSLGI